MLNERKLGAMIKWLAMAAEGSKHYRKLDSDETAYEYVVQTQIPEGIKPDFENALKTCPSIGRNSLREQTLRYMKKLSSYKPVN